MRGYGNSFVKTISRSVTFQKAEAEEHRVPGTLSQVTAAAGQPVEGLCVHEIVAVTHHSVHLEKNECNMWKSIEI